MEKLRHLMNFIRYIGLIIADKSSLGKEKQNNLLIDYIKLKTISLLPAYYRSKISSIVFLGKELRIFDLQTAISLIESIFIENEYYFRSASTSPKIIDLGGNIGLSVIYFKRLYPKSEIVCFEADATTYNVLKKNIQNFGLKKIKLYNSAVSAKTGKIKFYSDVSAPGSPLMSTHPMRISNNYTYVSSQRLSETINSHVDFIKMDIEGSEGEVVHDLFVSDKLKFIGQISIEYHHHIDNAVDKLSALLKEMEDGGFGYQIHASQNSPFVLRTFEDIQIHGYNKELSQ